MRHRSTIAKRIAAAEAALRPQWEARAMDILGDAINEAPAEVRRAIELRLRVLYRAHQADPSLNAGDPVIAVHAAVHDVAPELAANVAAKLGVDLPPGRTGVT